MIVVWLVGCIVEPPPVEAPACTSLTWEGFGQPTLTRWCTSCHHSELAPEQRGGAPVGLDFDTLADARTHADRIASAATGSAPRMPPGGGVDPSELADLATWLDCGLPAQTDAIPPCSGPVVAGPVDLATDADADALCGAGTSVDGAVRILGAVDIACLCSITGDLTVSGVAAGAVTLGGLSEVGGILTVSDNPGLVEVSVPDLDAVGGVMMVGNADLVDVDLRDLTSVSGDLIVEAGGVAGPLALDEVSTVEGDVILAEIRGRVGLSRLVDLRSDLRLTGLSHPDLDLGPLERVPGTLEICGTDAVSTLRTLDRLVEVEGDLVVCGNLGLEDLGLTDLTTVGGDLQITDNPALPTSIAEALADRVEVSGRVTIAGNLPEQGVRQLQGRRAVGHCDDQGAVPLEHDRGSRL